MNDRSTDHVDYKAIGQKIKAARKEKNLTQERLAEVLGVSVGYVSQVERGITRISLDLLGSISHVLEKDLSYFVSETAVNSPSYKSAQISDSFSKLSARDKRIISQMIDLLLNT